MATTSLFQKFLGSLGAYFARDYSQPEHGLTREPKQLASLIEPICTQLLVQLKYPGPPQLQAKNVEVLLEHMHKRAVEIGVPLNTSISAKGFQLGFAEGLVWAFIHSFSFLFSSLFLYKRMISLILPSLLTPTIRWRLRDISDYSPGSSSSMMI